MPNFKCKNIKELSLPFSKDGVSFCFQTKYEQNKKFIFTKVNDESFFLQINKKDEYVVKIDKLSKITNLQLMQKALEVFMNNFCEDITNKAFYFNENKKLANNILSSALAAANYINNCKKDVFIEIGFGSGRHLLKQAQNNKEAIFIGIEIHKPSLIQVSNLAKDLDNILLLDFDARMVLKLLKNNSINGLYLHFPVPWDDAISRRVISKEFKEELFRILKINAFFELRSDSLNYTKYALELFSDDDYVLLKNKEAFIVSKYEARWQKMGKDIYDFIFYKKEDKTNDVNKKEYDLNFSVKKLKKCFFKAEDYFVKLDRIYDCDDAFKIARISYGAFHSPSSSYILVKDKINFLFFDFCASNENIKALEKLKELLNE
ncbi:tRNA (guanosine(46)-N7)-methyltransferase TrmB [Campylobacter canadensis]|uniref:tRNA (guanine-N(7)-)-methyltransferase n=1 Tax=Campylobacter canadensis TaxID=449520 RepID=A0ABS7WRZ7_9BACT|nr:tRNA (guanosine(46)-N7)-methyltransferase TrmB [Campylobacter canadensis]MBZ7986724.1 tRNA (guanosine(46)-N7)-methyltransferase TrmB [Campylobacter canadensis]MBZ7997760.1 tRNA (guanosine(46)-N7)-methyltransferase TrmB [Campylobacter canadensis]